MANTDYSLLFFRDGRYRVIIDLLMEIKRQGIKIFHTACPLDCWDQCALQVRVGNGRVLSIEADPAQPVTRRVICSKGRKHVERLYHPERLHYPLLKEKGNFKPIDWSDALQLIAEKINRALGKRGPLSLLHFYDGGYGGLLKNLESRFFSALGGSTTHKGSLCWGAGLAAQKYDFGEVIAHPYTDLVNAPLIMIWGRNPAHTSMHLLPAIRVAREKGARVVLIDPLQTATAALADDYIRIRPGSDGALALGMARVMLTEELYDSNFVEKYCSGFLLFRKMCEEYTLSRVESLTGVPAKMVEELARAYATSKPAAIVIGIGLQRYSNGCNTVRAIDALAALSGNIGLPGGGASYANFRVTRYIDHAYLTGEDLLPQRRYYSKPLFAEALSNLKDPPIKFLYISRSNPLVQVGNTAALRRAMAAIPFIVTAEHFMTDTAAASDLVLPATAFLESVDLYFNSMSHQYLVYGQKVVEPPGECRNEYAFFRDLAEMLGVDGYPEPSADELLSRAIAPLTEKMGITLEQIKTQSPLLLPGGNDIPWAGRLFETGDNKYNFYSAAAESDGGDGLPCYHAPRELSDRSLRDRGYKYWFATPHARESIHSTHRLPCEIETPRAYISAETAAVEGLNEGEKISLSSKRGSINVVVTISERIPADTVVVYQGWWHNSGAAVNNLTPDRLSDLGDQAAYYDCLCRIDRAVDWRE